MSSYTLKPKRYYRNLFRGSTRLFDACWRVYRERFMEGVEEASSDHDVLVALDWHASRMVNNPSSSFYIYGE